MKHSLVCWNCGKPLTDIPLPISRHANCAACFEVFHCCRMCIHYDPLKQGQCRHDRADPPVNKETANFCDYYKPSRHAFSPDRSNRSDSAKSKLASLFGEADGEEEENNLPVKDDVRSKLDDLFND
jgi:hypothetical protein